MLEHVSPNVLEGSAGGDGAGGPAPVVIGDLRAAVERFERQAIQDALKRATGNKSRAAKELGISRFALQRKLDKYGVDKHGGRSGAKEESATENEAEEVSVED